MREERVAFFFFPFMINGWLGKGKSASDWKLFGNPKTIGALYNCPNLIETYTFLCKYMKLTMLGYGVRC